LSGLKAANCRAWQRSPVAERWPRAVIFDLDGTLIDSAGDIADALNLALEDAGLRRFSDDEVRIMVGGGARVLVRRALAAQAIEPNAELSDRLYSKLLETYRLASVARTKIYPGGRELLSGLAGQGIRLGVCTNKPAAITHDVLRKLELYDRFNAVVGGFNELPPKPDPAMMYATLRALKASAQEAVVIGDSVADVGAARAAGVPVILVSFGYRNRPASELGADLVIDSLTDAPAALAKMWSGMACAR
jgi:phosphoglycolate phosphatase